jgi:spoIIIJ-associated protein
MEWVETTAKSLEEAKEIALERLGIGPDDAEFEILEEPRSGLFGRVRGEARVRARVKPATVRPKQDRRNRRRGSEKSDAPTGDPAPAERSESSNNRRRSGQSRPPVAPSSVPSRNEADVMTEETDHSPAGDDDIAAIDVAEVQKAAEDFSTGLLHAFGFEGTATSSAEGTEIDVRIDGEGDGLGLLIGPGGRTLLAIQDLARVAAQRRLGDHETRLRIDIAGYREKRRVALERFAGHVAELVKESGVARSLDPMPSADRKVIHDTLSAIDGVATRSEGEDPFRRIIVSPA